MIDYIQDEGESSLDLSIQLLIQEHLASEYFFSSFFFYGLHKLRFSNPKTEENLFWQLNPNPHGQICPILPQHLFR